MKKSLILLLVSILFMLTFASAQITIQQPNMLYNAGDELTVSISVDSSVSQNNFLDASLFCDNDNQELFKIPLSVKANEPKEFSLDISLVQNVIGDLAGRCTIKASYGEESSTTSTFEISHDISITPHMEKTSFDPEEQLSIHAQSVKKNGQTYNGYAEATIEELDLKSSSRVNSGNFDFNFTIPSDAKSKRYVISIYTYEEDEDGKKINEGRVAKDIVVNKVVKNIDFALSDLNFSTGDTLVYRPLLIDQAGEYSDGSIDTYLIGPNSEEVVLGSLKQQTSHELVLNNSYYPGTWHLYGEASGLSASRSFEVERTHRADFNLENSTLVVTNTGNVNYINTVHVNVGEESQNLELNLKVGETKEYKINAPDGEYSISVEVDDEDTPLGRSYLTGNAISLEEVGEFVASDSFKYIMWGILILALASIALHFYRKNSNFNFYGHSPSKEFISSKEKKYNSIDAGTFNSLKRSSSKSAIEKGQRERSNIIVVKIKNYEELRASTSNALENIESAIGEASGKNFHIVSQGNTTIIICSPSLTGQADNNMLAINTARKIVNVLNSHNERFSQKIEFGVSVASGELITENDNQGFRYTPSGSAIPFAKKVADAASNEVLISDDVHKKTMSKVKVQRFKDYWKITRIADVHHSEFIERFKQRNR